MGIVIGAVMALALVGADPAMAQTQPSQERINTAIARAREVGIPVALLESKIAEGKAKGVSMDRIAAAIERREAALERASQALRGRPDVGTADLSVAADAVESGVSEAVLRTLAETAPRERRVVAIAALTQLVRLGHVPAAALERVSEALKLGPEALANLPAEAAAAAGRPRGETPGAKGLGAGISAGNGSGSGSGKGGSGSGSGSGSGRKR